MKTSTKLRLANYSTWIMVITISILIVFLVGYLIKSTFELETGFSRSNHRTDFFTSFGLFAFVVIFCTALLNITLNFSVIADSKMNQPEPVSGKKFITKKVLLYFIGFATILISLLFLLDYSSRNRVKGIMVTEATDLINNSQNSLIKIASSLSDTAKIKEIPKILMFFESQNSEAGDISIITSDQYNGDSAFLEILALNDSAYIADLSKPFINNAFYKCAIDERNTLLRLFKNKSEKKPFWGGSGNDLKYYYPIEITGKQFMLLFSRYKRDHSF